MTWADFYLGCFLLGLAMTMLSVLTAGAHVHLPHFHLHHGGIAHGGPHAGGAAGRGGEVSVVNFATLTAFLAWFGGTGYLLTRYYGIWRWLGVGVATAAGLGGATAVFWFIATVLVSADENLDPADFEMVGVVGRMTMPIRTGGTGELVYSQGGTRRTTAARSDDGAAVAKGTEVLVTRYERGIAYVRPWDVRAELGDTETCGSVAGPSRKGRSS